MALFRVAFWLIALGALFLLIGVVQERTIQSLARSVRG